MTSNTYEILFIFINVSVFQKIFKFLYYRKYMKKGMFIFLVLVFVILFSQIGLILGFSFNQQVYQNDFDRKILETLNLGYSWQDVIISISSIIIVFGLIFILLPKIKIYNKLIRIIISIIVTGILAVFGITSLLGYLLAFIVSLFGTIGIFILIGLSIIILLAIIFGSSRYASWAARFRGYRY